MSYQVFLYDKEFLRKAIEHDIGDYSAAPMFPTELIEAIRQRLISFGYSVETESKSCTEFIHQNERWGLQASVYSGEIAFSIPYWDDAVSAIIEAKEHAQALAREFDLGLTDQQDGEVIC